MSALWLIGISAFLGSTQTLADPTPVTFMSPTKVANLKAILPKVNHPELSRVLQSQNTMWYDHESMVPVYQDSVTPVLGVRANSIGRDLAVEGERLFDTNGTFHIPFGRTAGTVRNDNIEIVTLWHPPSVDGVIQPVAWYRDDTTRYRWIFPENTWFVELMFVKDDQNNPYVFEIRTRKRFANGWGVNAFRPYLNALELSDTVKQKRPNWSSTPHLSRLVAHLEDSTNLKPKRMAAGYYSPAFETIEGALDELPPIGDDSLVRELLTSKTFNSAEGEVWKMDGDLETYAPFTNAGFSIVPRNYQGGLVAVNDVSCNRCHQDTGRQLGEFNFNSLLYGEIWGEDRIFSWHLFDENSSFYGAYDRNRKLSTKLQQAGLIAPYDQSRHPDPQYRTLPRRFKIRWR